MRMIRHVVWSFAVALSAASCSVVPKPEIPESCVSFRATEVPDEARSEWKPEMIRHTAHIDIDSAEVPFMSVHLYRHRKYTGLNLSTYSFFDQMVLKAWGCRPPGASPEIDRINERAAVFENETWTILVTRGPVFTKKFGWDGRFTGIRIAVLGADDEPVFEKSIMRP